MTNYQQRITLLKDKLSFLKQQSFIKARTGTHHVVYISADYVIRFRDDNQPLLKRETKLLNNFEHPLMPKVVWSGLTNNIFVMIENRLPGQPLNTVWKNTTERAKNNIVKSLVSFLSYLNSQTYDYIYLLSNGKSFQSYKDYFTHILFNKLNKLKNNSISRTLAKLIEECSNLENIEILFDKNININLVHGDLINHNLLIYDDELTGILDWEKAMYADPVFDLARLFYYQEWARAYFEQNKDVDYESDFMQHLINEIERQHLITDKMLFKKQYAIIRASYFINAAEWSLKSSDPQNNIKELAEQWMKKG